MTARRKSRFWRLCRIYFRRLRMSIWVLVLLFLGILLYLNQVGLPGFVKNPLLEKLRTRGLDLSFSRLRLSFSKGIVADNVEVGKSNDPGSAHLLAEEASVRVNALALLRLRLQVDGINLRKGQLVWRLLETDAPDRTLAITNIQTELRFLPGDKWSLDNFRAGFAGATIRLHGAVTNASAMRSWRSARQKPPSERSMRRQLRDFADALERTSFAAPPELSVDIQGDALDLSTFRVRIVVTAADADTPWGAVSNARLTARLAPTTGLDTRALLVLEAQESRTKWADAHDLHLQIDATGGENNKSLRDAVLTLRARAAETRWATVEGLDMEVRLRGHTGNTNLVNGVVGLSFLNASSSWANATSGRFSAQWTHSLTNPVPMAGSGEFTAGDVKTKWADARQVKLNAAMERAQHTAEPQLEASHAWWTNLHPYMLSWQLNAQQASSNGVVGRDLGLAGQWNWPALQVTNLSVLVSTGRISGRAELNAATRQLNADLTTDADPALVRSLLTPGAQRWLSQFTWNSAPFAHSRLAVILPAWTNRHPDWRNEVRPTLVLDGEFDVRGGGTYRGVPVSSARSRFTYSNMCWHLPDLLAIRPEGVLNAEHRADDRTKAFYWKLSSTMDPREVGGLIGKGGAKVKELFTFTQAPTVHAQVWGYMRQPERTALIGHVTATNFTFRGESFSGVQARMRFTNNVLHVFEPRGQRGTQHLSAEGVMADFNERLVWITNAYCTAETMPMARAIGKSVAKAMAPYRFGVPPTVHVNGVVPMKGTEGADLRFIVEGRQFRWLDFHIPQIVGNVHWRGYKLSLSRVSMNLYGGEASARAQFQFYTNGPATYEFSIITTNTELKPLMLDVFSATNQVEGLLSGSLVVTKGDTDDWRRWDGYGSARLQDGLIWDIPVFGILSPVLNTISPGLGNSRANSGQCTFNMTNGVLHSTDMEIRSSGMRLQYRGTVDLEARLNARVEAELLRDVWLVGPLVSAIFWPVSKMFEYDVTGTLGDPQLEPVYLIPKLVALPLQPFKALKRGLSTEETNGNRTNAPPRKPAQK